MVQIHSDPTIESRLLSLYKYMYETQLFSFHKQLKCWMYLLKYFQVCCYGIHTIFRWLSCSNIGFFRITFFKRVFSYPDMNKNTCTHRTVIGGPCPILWKFGKIKNDHRLAWEQSDYYVSVTRFNLILFRCLAKANSDVNSEINV